MITSLCVAAALAACSRGDAKRASANGELARADTEPRVIAALAAPYRGTAVAGGGAIGGTITFAGTAPGDSLVSAPADPQVCGVQPRMPGVVHSGNRLGEAVVWLADVRDGKPMPLERRYELVTEKCAIAPRVQAALAGGTVNVASHDATVHHTRLVRQGPNETIDVVTEHDEGQVVPVSKALETPGLVKVTCDAHPWTRGWIAVFDHPYFAVTGADGAFTLDDVPPGDYTLVAWHPRFGRLERRVTVAAGVRVAADVELGATAVP